MSATRTRLPAEERRAQLLDVARQCFTADGYGTTTADVADRAGVSQALVIKYFRTKEELYRAAVIEPLLVRLGELVAQEATREADPDLGPADHLEQLIAVGTTWSRLIRDQAPSMLSLLRESAEFPDLQVRTLDLWRQLASGVAEEMAAYAARDDYLDFDVESITQAGLGAITLGALFSDDPERMVRSYFEMAMRGLLTDAGRRSLPAHVQEPRA